MQNNPSKSFFHFLMPVLIIWWFSVVFSYCFLLANMLKVYALFAKTIRGFTETIRSVKVYGPQNLKVYHLMKKSIRFFSESIRSWIR